MKTRGGGAIVNVGSMWALQAVGARASATCHPPSLKPSLAWFEAGSPFGRRPSGLKSDRAKEALLSVRASFNQGSHVIGSDTVLLAGGVVINSRRSIFDEGRDRK